MNDRWWYFLSNLTIIRNTNYIRWCIKCKNIENNDRDVLFEISFGLQLFLSVVYFIKKFHLLKLTLILAFFFFLHLTCILFRKWFYLLKKGIWKISYFPLLSNNTSNNTVLIKVFFIKISENNISIIHNWKRKEQSVLKALKYTSTYTKIIDEIYSKKKKREKKEPNNNNQTNIDKNSY